MLLRLWTFSAHHLRLVMPEDSLGRDGFHLRRFLEALKVLFDGFTDFAEILILVVHETLQTDRHGDAGQDS